MRRYTLKGFARLDKAASDYGMEFIIQEARSIMSKHPKYHEFLLAMGSCFFLDKNGDVIHNPAHSVTSKLFDFIGEYDAAYHFTGAGVRFKKDGKLCHNW